MNYTKPEVAVLGQAVRVIEQHVKTTIPSNLDALQKRFVLNPAYDLDE
jgi:hypothetical protein